MLCSPRGLHARDIDVVAARGTDQVVYFCRFLLQALLQPQPRLLRAPLPHAAPRAAARYRHQSRGEPDELHEWQPAGTGTLWIPYCQASGATLGSAACADACSRERQCASVPACRPNWRTRRAPPTGRKSSGYRCHSSLWTGPGAPSRVPRQRPSTGSVRRSGSRTACGRISSGACSRWRAWRPHPDAAS